MASCEHDTFFLLTAIPENLPVTPDKKIFSNNWAARQMIALYSAIFGRWNAP